AGEDDFLGDVLLAAQEVHAAEQLGAVHAQPSTLRSPGKGVADHTPRCRPVVPPNETSGTGPTRGPGRRPGHPPPRPWLSAWPVAGSNRWARSRSSSTPTRSP